MSTRQERRWINLGLCVVLLLTCEESLAREEFTTISAKEIIERLARLEVKVEGLDKRIDDVNKRIDDLSKRIDSLQSIMLTGFGILFTGMFTLIGFVIWDRRTALSPVIRKTRELEEREELAIRILREYARKEPKMEEVLKSLRLL